MKNEEFATAVKQKSHSRKYRWMMKLVSAAFFILHSSFFISSCARMGNPDGGWYDDTPPRVVSSSPDDKAMGVKAQKVVINFNEYIKVEDVQNKVIVSPPQIEQADIKAAGKRIIIDLKDTLKENTTYTIDFSDAISDNNEGNPMGNYTFSFSTGDHIDTLEVSGYCLNAENLEPIKGMLVGLYEQFDDSLFHTQPMMRVSRTNGSGKFTIKGVAPGTYRIYALQDADGDFVFGQKSEMIGFMHDSIRPSWKPDVRQDTIWRDSLHIDNILQVGYTHFLPDDVTLLCFQEPQTDRFLLKTERQTPEKFGFFFSYGDDSIPCIKGLNFDEKEAFVIEPTLRKDTVYYWLRDTLLVNMDTLRMEVRYHMTDTLGQLVEQTDTIEALSKVSYEKRQKELAKEREKWEKEQERKKKREQPYDTIMPAKPMKPKISSSGQIDPTERIRFEMPEPLLRCDTSMIHLYSKIDTLWYESPHVFRQTNVREYVLTADWQLGTEYSLEIDSAAFENIYGQVNDAIKQGLKVHTADEYSSLMVTLSSNPVKGDSLAQVVVQLIDGSDKVIREAVADADGIADFYYLKPGKYYLRALIDQNGNGQWDTGLYDEDRQAEAVYYHPEEVECKAKWDVERQWDLEGTPRYRQKPLAITKQKPDKEKQLKNRNLERAKQLGKEYVKENIM